MADGKVRGALWLCRRDPASCRERGPPRCPRAPGISRSVPLPRGRLAVTFRAVRRARAGEISADMRDDDVLGRLMTTARRL